MTSDEEWIGPVADECTELPLLDSADVYDGYVWSVRKDALEIHGATVERDVLIHPGAVAVVAIDENDRVLLIRQYRHPIAMTVFEPPAGLLDVTGEPPLTTARRELAEEAGYEAADWRVLVDFFNSPGGSSEAIRVYLARGLHARAEGRIHTGEAEEAYLPRAWVPLEDAVALVLAGAIGSPSGVLGILAAHAARARGWDALRKGDAAWGVRDWLIDQDRVRMPWIHLTPDSRQ